MCQAAIPKLPPGLSPPCETIGNSFVNIIKSKAEPLKFLVSHADLPPPLRVRVLHSGHEAHLLRCVCQTLDKPYSTSVMSNHGSGSSVAGTGPHADGRLLGAATIVGQDARAAGAAAAAGMEGHALRCHPPSPLACVSLANAWPERVVVLLDTKRSMYMVGSAGIEEGSCVCLHSYRCMGGGTGLLLALLWSHEV